MDWDNFWEVVLGALRENPPQISGVYWIVPKEAIYVVGRAGRKLAPEAKRAAGASAWKNMNAAWDEFMRLKHAIPNEFIRAGKKHIRCDQDDEAAWGKEKGIDVAYVVAVVSKLSQFDSVLLVTGDADMLPLVKYLRARKKKVYVPTFDSLYDAPGRVSRALLRSLPPGGELPVDVSHLAAAANFPENPPGENGLRI